MNNLDLSETLQKMAGLMIVGKKVKKGEKVKDPDVGLSIQVGFDTPTYLSVLSTDVATRTDVHGEPTIFRDRRPSVCGIQWQTHNGPNDLL